MRKRQNLKLTKEEIAKGWKVGILPYQRTTCGKGESEAYTNPTVHVGVERKSIQ